MLTILLFALAAHADTTIGNGTTVPSPGPATESPTNRGAMDFTNPNAPTYIPPGSTIGQPNAEPLMGSGISLSPTLPGNPSNSGNAGVGLVPGSAPQTSLQPPNELPNPNREFGVPGGAGEVGAGQAATPPGVSTGGATTPAFGGGTATGGTGGASSGGMGSTGGASSGGTR